MDLYPLRRSMFEGVPASVPFQYDAILVEEYKNKALTATNFHKYVFPSFDLVFLAYTD